MNDKTRVVLVDWDMYPLTRLKKIGDRTIACGILPFLENIRNFSSDAVDVILIINSDDPDNVENISKYDFIPKEFDFVSNVFIRNNFAMDIGAYDHGYKFLLQENYKGRIVFANSSVSGPHTSNWLDRYEQLFTSTKEIGLTGTTVNMVPVRKYNFLIESTGSGLYF